MNSDSKTQMTNTSLNSAAALSADNSGTNLNNGKSRSTTVQRTAKLVICALFTALTAVCSWISLELPFTPVPVNLATFAVMLSGCILGPVYGTISQIVYVLLGAVGAPVFSGGTGGFGIIAGPTGGYIIGYMLCAAICGTLSQKKEAIALSADLPANKTIFRIAKPSVFRLAAAMVLGTAACYAAGTLWFMYITGNGLLSTLMMCVVPYLPGDALKMIAGIAIIKRLPRSLWQ